MPHLKIIVASTRPGRVGRAVADWALEHAQKHGGFDAELVDLTEVGLPFFDEPHHPAQGNYVHQHTKDWSTTVDAADAFVIVMPEYNSSFNAPLKNALDFLYHEWQYKPVGFVSYGNTSAGTRAVQALKPVVTSLRMTPLNEAVAVHYVGDHVDDSGTFTGTESHAGAAKSMLDELVRMSAALAPLRGERRG